jgi:hypothetical protein
MIIIKINNILSRQSWEQLKCDFFFIIRFLVLFFFLFSLESKIITSFFLIFFYLKLYIYIYCVCVCVCVCV